jgi:hypothetical protein
VSRKTKIPVEKAEDFGAFPKVNAIAECNLKQAFNGTPDSRKSFTA